MRLIGLTGGIATGKSTVAGMLQSHGAVIVDLDVLAREVVQPGTPVLARIADRFGSDVVDADGALDRAALGAIVFADPGARLELERLTHPAVIELMQQQIGEAAARDAPVVVVDVPLLFETGREELFEGTLLVYAPPETQLRRMLARDGLDAADAQQRINAQLPIDDKRLRATWVIDNGGDIAATESQVQAWWGEAIGGP